MIGGKFHSLQYLKQNYYQKQSQGTTLTYQLLFYLQEQINCLNFLLVFYPTYNILRKNEDEKLIKKKTTTATTKQHSSGH